MKEYSRERMRIFHKYLSIICQWFNKAAESPQKYKEKYTPRYNKIKYRTPNTKRKF